MREDVLSQQHGLLAEAYQALAGESLADANRAVVAQAEVILEGKNVYNARVCNCGERKRCQELVGRPDGLVYVESPSGHRLSGMIPLERAKRFVAEGLAIVKGPVTIQVYWLRHEFPAYVLGRDHWTCHYCGKPGYTIDHLVPVSRGGLSTPANCVCACESCNKLKGNMTEEEFLKWKIKNADDNEGQEAR